MTRKAHLQILGVATLAWAAFWVIGLPDYYQQYSRAVMIGVCAVLIPPIVAIAFLLLGRTPERRRMTRAAWLAFYFTVPLALYDWLYCGVHLGYGWRFFRVFWYLTVFYVVPWIVLPATAAILSRRGAAAGERR